MSNRTAIGESRELPPEMAYIFLFTCLRPEMERRGAAALNISVCQVNRVPTPGLEFKLPGTMLDLIDFILEMVDFSARKGALLGYQRGRPTSDPVQMQHGRFSLVRFDDTASARYQRTRGNELS